MTNGRRATTDSRLMTNDDRPTTAGNGRATNDGPRTTDDQRHTQADDDDSSIISSIDSYTGNKHFLDHREDICKWGQQHTSSGAFSALCFPSKVSEPVSRLNAGGALGHGNRVGATCVCPRTMVGRYTVRAWTRDDFTTPCTGGQQRAALHRARKDDGGLR